jgi:hypothetical protein
MDIIEQNQTACLEFSMDQGEYDHIVDMVEAGGHIDFEILMGVLSGKNEPA